MKRRLELVTAIGLALACVGASALADDDAHQATTQKAAADKQPIKVIAGHWLGTLDAGVKLRVVVNIEQSPEGKLTATLDSPDQGARGIPIDQITLVDGTLRLGVKAVAGSFEGKVDLAGGEIVGTWKQSGGSLPLTLKPIDKLPEPKRPQEPKPPFPYDAREVAYENKPAGIKKLAGTLTLPRAADGRGAGPHPAVILITGSGAQNRDEELLGHKPFLVLADYLTRRGIAVLRVDDRGIGGSTGDLNQSTSADLAGDVLAGVEFLKSQKEIDPRRIGLVGHSEGGLIAPIAAARSDDVAFIVLIAGPGVTGEEILYAQGALMARAAGAGADAVAAQRKLQERMFAVVKEVAAEQQKSPQRPLDTSAAEKRIRKIIDETVAQLPEEQRKAAAGGRAVVEAQSKMVLTPWFRYFLMYDPRPTLAQVKCPVLAVNGERDMQVPSRENLSEIYKALVGGGNQNFTVRQLAGLNHLLQKCRTGSPSEYAQIEETMSPEALRVIGDWIHERVR